MTTATKSAISHFEERIGQRHPDNMKAFRRRYSPTDGDTATNAALTHPEVLKLSRVIADFQPGAAEAFFDALARLGRATELAGEFRDLALPIKNLLALERSHMDFIADLGAIKDGNTTRAYGAADAIIGRYLADTEKSLAACGISAGKVAP